MAPGDPKDLAALEFQSPQLALAALYYQSALVALAAQLHYLRHWALVVLVVLVVLVIHLFLVVQ